ncbi:MAG: ATPase [Caulobacter sp.]|nr:ATPase [Caulobacter sp.]
MTASESVADREFIMTRVFDAPARLLFQAYSQPQHLMKWFGPVGWPLTLCEVDFRVGGRYRFAMTGPSGEQNIPFGGQYLEIVPDRKIVFDNTFEAPGSETMVMTVTFEEAGGKTTLTLNTLFGSVAMKNGHIGGGFEEGTNSGFDQLAEVVAGMASA